MRETQRRLAAVWFADLVDYTRLAADDEVHQLRRRSEFGFRELGERSLSDDA